MDNEDILQQGDTEYVAQLLKLSQTLNSSLELEKVLNTAIESVVDFVQAQRGLIMLLNETDSLEVKAFKNVDKEEIEQMKGISKTVLEASAREGKKIISLNAQRDPRFKYSESVQFTGLRSVMCVPMKVKEKNIGVIYLDSNIEEGKFDNHQLNMLDAFANQAAIAIENAILHENLIKSYEEKIRLQEELHEQEKKRLASEEANRLKSEFVNIVAHELKSPLTVLKSYSSLLYRDVSSGSNRLNNEVKEEIYQTMERQIDRLTNMIRKQLDTASIDAGKPLELSLKEIDVKQILNDIIILLQTSPFYHEDSHEIETDIPDILPSPVWDGEKIMQVLYNLIENALKYSPDGGKILVKLHSDDKNMYFSISDNGLGISEEAQKNLFKKFERVQRDGRTIPGTGLGLYLIKHLVEIHKGEIGVKSENGKGSEFYFHLPITL